MNNTGQLYCAGNFINTSTAEWLNSGTLITTGNITNDQLSMSGTAGTTNLQGTLNQIIAGGQPFITFNTVFNNAAGITLNQSLRINGTGTFTNGIVTALNTNFPLIFGLTGTPATVTDASHVNGVVRSLRTSGTFTFPVGDVTRYRKVDVNFTANAGGMNCQYFRADAGRAPFTGNGADPMPLVAYFDQEYWNIQPVSTATATITIYYDQVLPPRVTNIAHLKVAHKRSTPEWVNEGGTATGTTTAGSVTSLPVSIWSPFTLGSTNLQSPLPVNLVRFDVEQKNNDALLIWRTATEQSSNRFEIESSTNPNSFTKVGEVKAAGNSSAFIDYQYIDPNITRYGADVIYYRLKQVDIDGKFIYSSTRLLKIGERSPYVKVYPTPFKTTLSIDLQKGWQGLTTINLTDMQGRLVYQDKENIGNTQTSILLSHLSALPTGSYILTLKNDRLAGQGKNEVRIKVAKE